MLTIQTVIEILEDNDNVDVFKQFYPDTLRYTWRKKNSLKHSRFDFFLIFESLLPSVKLELVFLIFHCFYNHQLSFKRWI